MLWAHLKGFKLAEEHGDQWEKTLSEIALGQVQEEFGASRRSEQTTEAKEFLDRLEAEIKAEMVDRTRFR
ncbi:hypothetical protein Enr13x_38410 [Stieleria neptunia]|uniref:Uncharacterized protein n=1 Tax=Stieleria neptunia TaxID=2527979 RepID=A0A518HSZ9_9BACT|nr:hypothetical protein [Stieleria neptunia]QDV43980.1 hypothetical protein Enr13x_38410 [Stieleria neptunia]